jgi:DNA-binding transcriptional LysR family regulator
MKRLSAELGVPLFNAAQGSVELTEYGRLFLDCSERVERSLDGLPAVSRCSGRTSATS